ncbi:NAD-dependent epimerase/dehydratase family protein [Pseudohoeflea coraliihabitans]|uniref:NAD(P)-dependent oxidoreductase n=1 Tax=Pseudohoeflea coraliihabitans TaxID=2860393 RepID=A0ABS6WS43_9HYPH|nr:NAD(P)-dependent oxidoreductase [Pseudohoeflea sp. DP4N28-3]MBW3098232.1 NAD(P)-dependent oxidoreductase [Pseudohoeflea sp. DP4N28-3]
MKHIIFGGDGFVGNHLAKKLLAEGQEVIVADVSRSEHSHYGAVKFIDCDVRDIEAVRAVPIDADDAVYNMSAKMLSPLQVRAKRHEFFWPVNFHGAGNIMKSMDARGASRLVQFTTDMIYGHTVVSPQTEDHPQAPLGEYGKSKLATEKLCEEWRRRGMNVSIFRPRLIIGPGRLGILEKLFKLVDLNLPVPMIGSGKAPYQFISVYDCAEAARLAWKHDFPNSEYNLGSKNPPSVRTLLGTLIRHAGSKSILVPTPGFAVKKTLALLDLINKPLMDPEQYLIADEMCVRETDRAERDLNFVPQHDDIAMLMAAYDEYRAKKAGVRAQDAAQVAPAE